MCADMHICRCICILEQVASVLLTDYYDSMYEYQAAKRNPNPNPSPNPNPNPNH